MQNDRIGRLQYFLRMLGISTLSNVFMRVIVAGAGRDSAPILLLVALLTVVFAALQVVKRLHDLDRPGWHYFLCLVPIYGFPYLGLVLLFKRGTVGPNRYGLDPTDPLASATKAAA